MSDDEEPLSLSDTPGLNNKVIKRKVSYDKLLKNKYINYPEEELVQMNEKRNELNLLTKKNDLTISKMLSQNKKIEEDFKLNDKLNKKLIFRKNELNRNIQNVMVNGVGSNNNLVKNKYKINNINKSSHQINKKTNPNNIEINNNEMNDNNMENELENEAEFNEPEKYENEDIDKKNEKPKLFGKNPNKNPGNNDDMENINERELPRDENMEHDNDEVENNNMNDSNLNEDGNNNKDYDGEY